MRRVGLLVAVETETLLARWGAGESLPRRDGFAARRYVRGGTELFVLDSGAGEIAAAAAAQFLITGCGAELVVNFGVVGGLDPALRPAEVCIVTHVVHYDWDTSQVDPVEPGRYRRYPDVRIPAPPALVGLACAVRPSLRRVVCASGDKFIGDPEQKRALRARFGADICEMEAAGNVLTCDRAQVPCLLLKAVADSAGGGAAEFRDRLAAAAASCLTLTEEVLRRLDAAEAW